MKTFDKISTTELNKIIDTKLTDDMDFVEVYEELDRTENRYFYISLAEEDVLEAYENEKEITDQLDLWFVCIEPQEIYVALHQ